MTRKQSHIERIKVSYLRGVCPKDIAIKLLTRFVSEDYARKLVKNWSK